MNIERRKYIIKKIYILILIQGSAEGYSLLLSSADVLTLRAKLV
jgi:hypothetical protein